MKNFTVLFSVILLIFLSTGDIFAEDPPELLQEEAPATLWDMNIGDADVDLYLEGYWKMGIMAGTSAEWNSDGIVFPAAFPGLTSFSFYQAPDLTISLWLMNRYYLETSFVEGFDKNTYAVGYRGMEGEFVQSVRIANNDVKIEEYKGLNVPSPKYNTPGISASFQTASSYHDVLVRYDPSSAQEKVFLGEYEVTEEVLNIGSYTRGQYFILPDENVDFIDVYIADEDGIYQGVDFSLNDELTYRKASANEVSYSLSKGTVTLKEASKTDVLVFYEKGSTAVGDSSLGRSFIAKLVNGEPDPSVAALDFDWSVVDDTWDSLGRKYEETRKIDINGVSALKIYNPQKFGPFEYFNIYNVGSSLSSDSWKTTVNLVDKSYVEASDSDDFDFDVDSDDKIISVFKDGYTDIRSPYTRYPLADDYAIIYGSDNTDDDLTGRSILVSTKNQSGYNLGTGVIQGSVEVHINGNKTSSATVDYDTGVMSFSQYIFSSDRIEVSYRTETVDLTGGDLLFAQGNRFYPSDNLEIYLAEMFRWNVSESSSSSLDETSPGGLTIAGGLEYNTDNFNMELNTTLSLQTEDTTGILSIQGMEDSGYSFSIGESLMKQSPDSVTGSSGTRADLTYVDYFSDNGMGQYYLNSYTWSGATEDTDKSGPSVAAGISSDDFDSYVMVMEYDLADDEWSAGDLLLSSESPIDLSRFTSVSMSFKTLDSSDVVGNIDDINVKLLIGETGEREDWNDDGFITKEDPSLLFSRVVTEPVIDINTEEITIVSDGVWYNYSHEFTDSEMDRLTKSRAVRIVIEDAATGASGRLLVADVHFEGSLFDSKIIDSGTGDEIIYDDHPADVLTITETSDTSLTSAFSEVSELFHSSGEEQKALKVEWDLSSALANDGEYWIIETNTEAIPVNSYETFSFYMKSSTTSETYSVKLTNSDEEGYSFNYTPSTTGWKKLNLSLETGKVTDSSGSTISQANVDSISGALSLFRITSAGTDTSGTMYLDELHYSDPTFSLDGTIELITDYKYPGDIITTMSGFPVLSDFSLYNQLLYSGGKVLTTSADGSHSIENNTSLTIELLMLEINGNMKVDWSESETELSGSHALTFPSDFTYGYIYDSYSRSGDSDSNAMTRENKIVMNLPDKGNAKIGVSASGDSDLLLQTWGGDTQWNILYLLSFGADLTFKQQSEWDYRNQDNYFMNWIDDYRLIAPTDTDVDSRGVSSNLNFELQTKPVGFTLNPYLSFDNETGSPSEQVNRGGFQLTVPFTFVNSSGKEWSLTPSYSRSFVQESEKESGNSFSDGFNNLSQDLGKWMPLTSFIPFYELFASSPVSDFEDLTDSFDQADYSPELGIAISRKFGSTLYDLFLPYYFNAEYGRNFNKNDDSYSNSNSMEFTVKQTAINLFGEFGVYSQFTLYNTDEFTSSLQLNMSAEGSNIPEPDEIIYQNYLSFYGNNKSALSFENRFENDFQDNTLSDILDFKFLWHRPMRDKFAIAYLNTLINKQHFWSHEETLGFDLSYPYDDNDESPSLTVNVKHLSKVTVPDLGSLKTWLTLGFYGEDDLFMAGFEAGLELVVSF